MQICLPDLNSQAEEIPFLGIWLHLPRARAGKDRSRAYNAKHYQALAKVAAFLAARRRAPPVLCKGSEIRVEVKDFVKDL